MPVPTSRTMINRTPEWKALAKHKKAMEKATLRSLFARDSNRARKFSTDALGIHFDHSKNLINDTTMKLLFKLAKAAGDRKSVCRERV